MLSGRTKNLDSRVSNAVFTEDNRAVDRVAIPRKINNTRNVRGINSTAQQSHLQSLSTNANTSVSNKRSLNQKTIEAYKNP
jgi:hypothetical protein